MRILLHTENLYLNASLWLCIWFFLAIWILFWILCICHVFTLKAPKPYTVPRIFPHGPCRNCGGLLYLIELCRGQTKPSRWHCAQCGMVPSQLDLEAKQRTEAIVAAHMRAANYRDDPYNIG